MAAVGRDGRVPVTAYRLRGFSGAGAVNASLSTVNEDAYLAERAGDDGLPWKGESVHCVRDYFDRR